MLLTFKSFINSFRKISELKYILKTSLIILITAESACILTAETIGIIFYNHSIVLSIPLALLVGALTIVIIGAYKTIKTKSKSCCDCNGD
jgi:hypothetical protein